MVSGGSLLVSGFDVFRGDLTGFQEGFDWFLEGELTGVMLDLADRFLGVI